MKKLNALLTFFFLLGIVVSIGRSEQVLSQQMKEEFKNLLHLDSDIEWLLDYAQQEDAKEAIRSTLDIAEWIKHARDGNEEPEDSTPYFPGIDVDPKCLPKEMHYYRTLDGSCNWLQRGQADLGVPGAPFGRDRKAHFKPGTVNEPRPGPNPREVSNAFFENKKTSFWDHTFFLSAWVEFLVHDLMLSGSGREPGDKYRIPVPKCDKFFDPECTGNQTMPFWRTKRAPGTGENGVPREIVNDQTIWIDLSSIYGTSKEVNDQLRTMVDGKLIMDGKYLPINDGRFNFPMVGRQTNNTFVAGDVRANQDFALTALHTIFALEHNRLCDVLKGFNPEWDDETLFQTARIALTTKMSLVGASYFLAYYTTMPNPTPLSVWEQWYDTTVYPWMKYPWRDILDPETGAPFALPNEFSIGYRWHVLLPPQLALVNEKNMMHKLVNVPDTAFDAASFKDAGLEDILRGMAVTSIPDFHSGTQDAYRNMQIDFHDPHEGKNFDITTWAIEHERERGCPTYNEFVKGYNGKIPLKPKKSFEEFTDNPQFVAELKRLYNSPDDVDLMVGQELDTDWWPNTHIPKSMLAISFYTLFRASVSDRFTLSYNLFWCFLEGKPWNCKTNNALQDLLWKPVPSMGKNAKWIDSFWVKEFDIKEQGANLMHNMITQNLNIKCLQKNVFFLPDEKTNPIICYDVDAMPGPDPITGTSEFEFLAAGLTNIQPYVDMGEQYGDIAHYKLSRGGDYVLLSSAELMNQMYQSPKYTERVQAPYFGYTYGRVAGFKDGTAVQATTTSRSPTWNVYRSMIQKYIVPLYSSYIPDFNTYARQLTQVFARNAGKIYEPYNDVRRHVFEVMSHMAWGDYVDRDPAKKQKLFEACLWWIDDFFTFEAFETPWPWFMGIAKRNLDQHMDVVSDFEDQLLQHKRATGFGGQDWFGLLANNSLDGKYLSDKELKAIIFELVEANLGPMPSLITYGLYLLGSNQTVANKIYNEIKSIGERDITVSDLHKFPILLNTVKEITRAYPSGGGINIRLSTQEDVIGGYQTPYNTNFVTNTWKVQNDERYFENPHEFNPDRWNKPETPGSWTPFGAGPRGCIGKDFALIEASITIAHLVRNFEVSYVGSAPPEMGFTLIAYFKNPLQVKLIPRVR